MLEEKNRLRKKKDFDKIWKEGESFREDFIILKIKKAETSESRCGFIVSQKVSKKAVIRNKVKRRFREVVKEMIKTMDKADVLLIALPESKNKEFKVIKKTIEKLLKRAGVLNNKK